MQQCWRGNRIKVASYVLQSRYINASGLWHVADTPAVQKIHLLRLHKEASQALCCTECLALQHANHKKTSCPSCLFQCNLACFSHGGQTRLCYRQLHCICAGCCCCQCTKGSLKPFDITNVLWNAQVAANMTADNGTVFSTAAFVPAVQYVARLVDYNAWNDTVQAKVSVQLIQAQLPVITFCAPLPCSEMPTELASVPLQGSQFRVPKKWEQSTTSKLLNVHETRLSLPHHYDMVKLCLQSALAINATLLHDSFADDVLCLAVHQDSRGQHPHQSACVSQLHSEQGGGGLSACTTQSPSQTQTAQWLAKARMTW